MSPEFEINNKLVPFMIDKKKSKISMQIVGIYIFLLFIYY